MPDGGRFSHEIEDPLQTPPDVHADDTSENILRKLDSFAQMMGKDNLGYLYDKWRSHPVCLPDRKSRWASQPVYGQGWQEKTDQSGGMWRLKIINFGLLWGMRGRLNNLHTSAGALDGAAGAVVGKLQAAWTSQAGEAAVGKFNDLRAASQVYGTDLQTLAGHVEGAWRTTRDAVTKLAGFGEQGAVGGKPMGDRYGSMGGGEGNGAEVRADLSRYLDEMQRILDAGSGGGGHGVFKDWPCRLEEAGGNEDSEPRSAAQLHQPGTTYLTDGNNRWSNEICNELNDMCEMYFQTIANFRRQIEETIHTVEQAWDALNAGAGALSGDAFGKLSLAGASKPEGEGKPEKKDTGGGGRDSGGGGQDSGGGTGGTGSGSGGTGTPAVSTPEVPEMPEVPEATDPAAAETGEPTQQPPGAAADTGAQETVTIEDGDRKISVASPDGQGHVKVTVDDGSGTPKSYDLDFGAGTGTGGASDPSGVRTLPADPNAAAGGFGPDGQAAGGSGESGIEHVQAGPDGKAVVHDGDLTITAERPDGAPDTVLVTVDDGTGTPTTYTLDYQDPAAPTVDQGQGAPPAGQVASGASAAGYSSAPGDQQQVPAQQNGHTADQQPTAQPVAASASAEPVQSTFAASVTSGAGEAQWGAAGSIFDGDGGPGDTGAGDRGSLSGGDIQASGAGEAGLASASGDQAGHGQPGGQSGSGLGGGMPMMGGGAGGGGGGGGDQERSGGGQWRTTGDLFADEYENAEARIRGTLGGDRPN